MAAHIGRVDEARAQAELELVDAEAMDIRIAVAGSTWLLGFLELSLGDPSAALPHLRRSYELRSEFMLEPAQRLELGDLLEALVAVGELDQAEELIAGWHERADALDRAWALAILARSRGLVLAARGDLEGAFGSFERALSEHARTKDPFQQARTLLLLGAAQRRAQQRGAARTTLVEALSLFERLGSSLWAEKTRAELGSIGGRARNGGLTPAEQRVAALVAEGRTNREVAAALFLGERTVASHLTHIYAKLGIRSRTELARTLSEATQGKVQTF
jgi:DNA-binding CsgD family transcriptional regulator